MGTLLAHHDDPIGLLACHRRVRELGDVFGFQTQILEATLNDDLFLDLVRPLARLALTVQTRSRASLIAFSRA